MPAVGGYGYTAQLAIFEEGFGPSISYCYITQNEGGPVPLSGNIDALIYNGPDNSAVTNFERGNYIISANDNTKHYNYKITKTATAYTVEIFDENNVSVESISLNITGNDGAVQYDDFAFAVCCEYTDEDHPPIIKAGIGCSYFGLDLNTGFPIEGNNHCFQWFTTPGALEILKDCIIVSRFQSEGGTVITRLKESNDFIITQLPDEIFGKEIVNYGGTLITDTIPLSDQEINNPDDYLRYIYNSLSPYHSPYTGSVNYYTAKNVGMFPIHRAFLDYYKEGVGSDLFRKTADGKFTNAGDLASYNDMTIKWTSSTPYDIEFNGGIMRWRREAGQTSPWFLDFCDSDGNVLDTWHAGGMRSPSIDGPVSGYYYTNIATAFLCKSGNNFYIVGETIGVNVVDGDDNHLPDTYYNESICYAILKKLNIQVNAILNNATEQIVEYNKEKIDENSEAGSTPQDAGDLYDQRSIWDSGDHAGENTGIRHNGSDIIDASNGELTGDHPVGQVPYYDEQGENRIPTPLNTKMIVGFAPTPEEMETFSDVIKQTDFLDKMMSYFVNAVDGIVSAHTCIAPALDKGPDCFLKYGAWNSAFNNLTMKTLIQKMYHCYMGSVNLLEKRNSYKDYPPFCNYKIYLPYIGEREIDGRILVGKQLSLYYHINVLTGDILAELRVENQASFITSSFYYWTGNTLEPFALTSRDFSSQIQSGINAILSTGTAIASGVSGNALGAFTGGISAVKNISDAFRPDIRMIGTVGGNMAQNMFGQAYIIMEYPYLSETNPYKYKRLMGLPSNIGNKVSFSSTGMNSDPNFVSFKTIDLYNLKTQKKGLFATDTEKEEIDSLLKAGVYV